MAIIRSASCKLEVKPVGGAYSELGQTRDYDFPRKDSLEEVTPANAETKTFEYGLEEWSFSGTVTRSDANNTAQGIVQDAFIDQTEIVAKLTIGAKYYEGTVLVSDFTHSAKPGGSVEMKIALQGSGNYTYGTVA